MKKEINIFGAGGHATSVANVALALGYRINSFIDPSCPLSLLHDSPIVANINDIEITENSYFAIAIGDNYSRELVYKKAFLLNPFLKFPSLIHPSSIVSSWSKIGSGTILMPQSVIGANCSIGDFCIINTLSSVDHDSILGDFTSLAPGVICGGKIHIGSGSFVGISASIKHGISIGCNTIIGAASYVNSNIPPSCIAYGTPAKFIRSRKNNDSYLNK